MKHVLVTGAGGQLGQCIQSLKNNYPKVQFSFASISDLDITDLENVQYYFKSKKFDWCINCAAYTAVDKAEIEKEKAYLINVKGIQNLARACSTNSVKLIHISTDFVFNGESNLAYNENAEPEPLGVYGQTKLDGEIGIGKVLSEFFILRTSWLYSEFGHNFMKSMLRLAEERSELNLVSDQIGTPTYARDLVETILDVIDQESTNYGIYHYSNEGVASWYDFAKAIFEIRGISIKTNPIKSEDYPTPAKRPFFSVLDKSKIKKTFHIEIPYWRDSLKTAISNFNE